MRSALQNTKCNRNKKSKLQLLFQKPSSPASNSARPKPIQRPTATVTISQQALAPIASTIRSNINANGISTIPSQFQVQHSQEQERTRQEKSTLHVGTEDKIANFKHQRSDKASKATKSAYLAKDKEREPNKDREHKEPREHKEREKKPRNEKPQQSQQAPPRMMYVKKSQPPSTSSTNVA